MLTVTNINRRLSKMTVN